GVADHAAAQHRGGHPRGTANDLTAATAAPSGDLPGLRAGGPAAGGAGVLRLADLPAVLAGRGIRPGGPGARPRHRLLHVSMALSGVAAAAALPDGAAHADRDGGGLR